MQDRIAAGIVTFNPHIERLRKNIEAVAPQVDKIFLIDNGSGNKDEIAALSKEYPCCEIIQNQDNQGLAKALNQLLDRAEHHGFTWVLTLDDDSVCDADMVRKFQKCTDRERAGIICPIARDDRTEQKKAEIRSECSRIEHCITAGSLTNVEAWRAVGGFDERMFIDFVDIEFCTRLRENGYRIWQVKDTFVHQQYGNIRGSFTLFGRKLYRFDYSPTRVYYSVRNQIYYLRKHRKSVSVARQIAFLTGYIGKRIVFERQRIASVRAVTRGLRDGIRMQI